jgi:signal transduction histidine kinase
MRYTLPGSDGRPMPVEGRIWAVPEAARGALGATVLASAFDISDRVAADAAEARVVQLLAAMPGILLEFIAAPDGTGYRVAYASPSVERLIGWTEAEAQVPGWWEALTLDAPEARIAALLPVLRQAGEAVLPIRFRCRLALHRDAAVTFRLVRREGGERVVAYFADVTAERQARERLGQMAQSGLIGDIAVGFSHEVNQPLSIISMGLQNLQRALRRLLPAEEAMHARMQRMVEQSLRVGRMTEEFRALGGEAGEQRQALDAVAVAQGVAGLLAPEAAAVGVILWMDLPASLPAVLGHALSLRQALIELIRAALIAYQARDEAAAEDVVTLAARVDGEALVLSVSDAAGPIPPALLGQVFLPFAAIRTAAPSGGLGLAKCWQAALAMQASVVAVNAGAGVRFELRLALAPVDVRAAMRVA